MANVIKVRPCKLDIAKIKTECIELFKEYVTKNILELSKECFDIKVTDYIYNHIMYSNINIINGNNSNNGDNEHNDTNEKIKTIVKKTVKTAWCKIIPYRSYAASHIRNIIANKSHLDKKLDYLRNMEQPAQRTAEWYTFRHNLLTAS